MIQYLSNSFLTLFERASVRAKHNKNQHVVVADSAFASVNTAEQLAKWGHHFIGLIKTAHKKSPKTAAIDKSDRIEMGEHLTFTTTTPAALKLVGYLWKDIKSVNFIFRLLVRLRMALHMCENTRNLALMKFLVGLGKKFRDHPFPKCTMMQRKS